MLISLYLIVAERMGFRLWEECASWQGRGLYKGEGARGALSEVLPPAFPGVLVNRFWRGQAKK